jgi:2,4-dienoyl-CoA reductase-like NADH-dependent reductase (Old Yellow Enzyme family)
MPDQNALYPHLFTVGRLGALELKNRYVVAPMTRISASSDGAPTSEMAEHYAAFARGGFALVITEGTYTDEAHAQGYRDQPGIANEAQAKGWRKVTEAVHAAGAPIVMQLLHVGALCQSNRFTDETIAPSPIQPVGEMAARYYGEGRYRLPREITRAEIAAVIESFVTCADRAMRAGFDGVEIHGANGYLPDQFLTERSNQRSDEYGGALENRVRFHREVIEAVRKGVAGRGIVGVRISQSKVNDFTYEWPGGLAEAEAIFRGIADAKPDYIHISTHRGLIEVFGSGLNLAGVCRRATGATTIACGGLHNPRAAEDIIAGGEADFAAVGKGALADPHLVKRIGEHVTPVAFNPEMITPVATLETTRRYRETNGLSW